MKHLRKTPRTKIDVQKTIPVKMRTDEGKVINRYVRVLDLSEGGLRLTGDLKPPAEPFQLEFDTRVLLRGRELSSTKLSLRVTQRWEKEFYGNMWMGGFQFLEMNDEQKEIIRAVINEHDKTPKEPEITAEHKVTLGIKKWGKINWYYPLISKLDGENIEFQTTENLNLKGSCKLALSFRPTQTTIEVDADFISQEAMGSMVRYKLNFKNLSPEDLDAISAA